MPCLIYISAILILRSALAGPLSGEEGDVNLFLGSDFSSLAPDDSSLLLDNSLLLLDNSPLFSDNSPLFSDELNQWPVNPDDPSLNQLSPGDQSDNIFDNNESVELAGVNDLCAAVEDTSLVGKMRARSESTSCINPNANTNQLNLPDWNTAREILAFDEGAALRLP